jgi:hypothetical protein
MKFDHASLKSSFRSVLHPGRDAVMATRPRVARPGWPGDTHRLGVSSEDRSTGLSAMITDKKAANTTYFA